MACFHPLKGYKSKSVNPETGRRAITFKSSEAYTDLPITVPCGQCIGCRAERARQWAVRCMHEASLWEDNCFITLTYATEHLPPTGSLEVSHFQKFMKRLRKSYPGKTIRFYHCGEYGDKNGRPHYHALIFNHQFEDLVEWPNRNGSKLYVSEKLTKLWPYGFSTIGELNYDTASYVARYVMKKINGKQSEHINPDTRLKHYENFDSTTGEIHTLKPEYTTMSRRPGIAHDWYQKYKHEVYPDDFVITKSKRVRPPKYYDTLYESEHAEHYEAIKQRRMQRAKKHKANNTPERLHTREKVKRAQINQLQRNL